MRKIFFILWILCNSCNLICSQTQQGNIESYVSDFINNMPLNNGNDYQAPSNVELNTWSRALTALQNNQIVTARREISSLGYQIIDFMDTTIQPYLQSYILTEKIPKSKHWGLYILNPNPCREQLILQSPHPKHDRNTGLQGIYCYKHLRAKAFFVSGTHRCNHTDRSACSGTTQTCGNRSAFRISDMPHIDSSIFHRSTQVLYQLIPNSVFVQLHGFGKRTSDPFVILSNGSQITPTVDYISLLAKQLYLEDTSLTFKIAHIDLAWRRLRGFYNLQGRYINNSASDCHTNASTTTGRFIHLEQERLKLRATPNGWNKLKNALGVVFICNRIQTSSLKIKKQEIAIQLYPNPTKGGINLNFDSSISPSSFLISNILGQVVWQQKIIDKTSFAIPLPPKKGVYILQILFKNKKAQTFKIIKN